jgi:hypothetical protein
MRSFILEFLAYLTWTVILLTVGALAWGYIYYLGQFIAYTNTLPYQGLVTIAFIGGCMIIAAILQRFFGAIGDRIAGRAAQREYEDRSRHF